LKIAKQVEAEKAIEDAKKQAELDEKARKAGVWSI
jgi:hypothetical protein